MRPKILLFGLFFVCLVLKSNAQSDTLNPIDLKELLVTGFHSSSPHGTSLNIEPYSLDKIESKSPYNLSDALARLPGISQMTTSNAISKPVIRGLFGNRILVLLSGLRFDNQQWQDEHGLGLSQIGIERVEIIKGPASLLYGTDAIGGVINVIEEKPDGPQPLKIDLNTRFHSNTLGTLTDIGFSKASERRYWRLRAGFENHADYSDGHGKRVLNSRNNGYYLKAGLGFKRAKWIQDNSFNSSLNRYGFILEDLNSFFSPDDRYSRAMSGPHHIVLLNILNSQNTFFLPASTLKINAGVQSNSRMEDEGGGQISLNMHLFSALENLRWEKQLTRHTLFVLNHQFTFENNTNYGGRIIVPDANLVEANVSGFLRFYIHKLIIETGLGGNFKTIQTFQTRTQNAPDKEIKPFSISHPTGNAMLGLVYNQSSELSFKANTGTGFRAGNLAELASNGLHEGVFRYEVGDPNLKIEQNLNSDLSAEYNSKILFLSASVFYNRFFNYIYLAPTQEKYFGYQVFRYRQQDAHLQGLEATMIVKNTGLKNLAWKETFSLIKSKLEDGGYLPFIAPAKLVSSLRYEKQLDHHKLKSVYLEGEWIYNTAQKVPAQFETQTAAYQLFNVYTGVTIPVKNGGIDLNIAVNNIANLAYADHLSRLKYYGLNNQGRNAIISLKWHF
ncbi:MAG: TonB-dependent receptor [Bacteroidota bacterium]